MEMNVYLNHPPLHERIAANREFLRNHGQGPQADPEKAKQALVRQPQNESVSDMLSEKSRHANAANASME